MVCGQAAARGVAPDGAVVGCARAGEASPAAGADRRAVTMRERRETLINIPLFCFVYFNGVGTRRQAKASTGRHPSRGLGAAHARPRSLRSLHPAAAAGLGWGHAALTRIPARWLYPRDRRDRRHRLLPPLPWGGRRHLQLAHNARHRDHVLHAGGPAVAGCGDFGFCPVAAARCDPGIDLRAVPHPGLRVPARCFRTSSARPC